MKKIFTYMAVVAVAVLTACSDSDIADISTGTAAPSEYSNVNSIVMPTMTHEEGWENAPEIFSKSTYDYDYTAGKMAFSWTIGDKVGVYPVKYMDGEIQRTCEPGNSTVIGWTIHQVQNSGNNSFGIFDIDDAHISTYYGESYIAVYPYILDDRDYRDIPITYEGQLQTESPKIGCYVKRATPEQLTAYVNSEKAACEHLTPYDYMVDKERLANEIGGKIRFQMKRLGATVRFYMVAPENIVFDSLQLYNPAASFVKQTTLDASQERFVDPTKTSHVMSLQLNRFGFDYTTRTANDDYYYNASIGWIMIGYMMVAPIDLSGESTPMSTLYLIGREPLCYTTHDEYNTAWGTTLSATQFAALTTAQKIKLYDNVDDYNADNHKSLSAEAFAALSKEARRMVYPDVEAFNAAKGTTLSAAEFEKLTIGQKITRYTRKVFKADNLAKKNIQADIMYQWAVRGATEDDPIEFNLIEIQEWKNGPGFTNAEGVGTEDW